MFRISFKHVAAAVGAAAFITAGAVAPAVASGTGPGADGSRADRPVASATTTPIKHVVVIFQENVSFDHYFATYPDAANLAGETRFTAAAGTPTVNGLNGPLNAPNNPNSVQPFRLSPSQAVTCDQDHTYTDEQKAFDSGLMDKFVETVGRGAGTCADYGKGKGLVMGYYDGNTVTGPLELRAAFRDERQLVRHHLRPLHPRRAQPRLGPDARLRDHVLRGDREHHGDR